MMCSTCRTCTANCITDRQLRSLCTTTLATLRCTKSSPGRSPTISLAGTRLSEQPIQRYLGRCCRERRAKNSGSFRRIRADHSRFFSRRFVRAVMAGILPACRPAPGKPDPRGGMIARLLASAMLRIHAVVLEPRHEVRREHEEIHAEARIARMGGGIHPECVDALLRPAMARGVDPALRHHARPDLARLRLQHRVEPPGAG